MTLVENEPALVPEIRDRLAGRIGRAIRIGVTGPPGVGKSTLATSIAQRLIAEGHRVGVVAVDPTSPFTGGAFMGDRVRMESLVGEPRAMVRSLASREGRGGLSPATESVADVLEGFGFDRILIETVGVGQAELDVMACADLVVLVLQPSTGDAIQSLKAGILEAADVVAVNKADLPGAPTVLQSLRFVYSIRADAAPPIHAVSAQTGEGVQGLADDVERLGSDLLHSGRHLELRRRRLQREIVDGIREALWRKYQAIAPEGRIAQIAAELASDGGSPYPYIRTVAEAVRVCPGVQP